MQFFWNDHVLTQNLCPIEMPSGVAFDKRHGIFHDHRLFDYLTLDYIHILGAVISF